MAKKEKKKSSFFKDFKAFITRGNVIDMAVGVVIGGAFGKIVTGLVNYIINPFIGIFMEEGGLDSLKTVIHPEKTHPLTGEITQPETAILWGTWLQTIIDFIIVAFCIFVVVRIITKIRNKLDAKAIEEAEQKAAAEAQAAEEAKAAAEAQAAELAKKQAELDASTLAQEKLLVEIRDLLKNK